MSIILRDRLLLAHNCDVIAVVFQGRQVAGGSRRKIMYGCSELLNATSFLQQLTDLGKQM